MKVYSNYLPIERYEKFILSKDKFKNIPNVKYEESIEKAIRSIPLKEGDLIIITGSLYLAGEVLNLN